MTHAVHTPTPVSPLTARWRLLAVLFAAVAPLVGCSDDPTGATGGQCADGSPACGRGCSQLNPCPAGNFCGTNGQCQNQCPPATVGMCGDQQVCGSDGRCPGTPTHGERTDGGMAPDASDKPDPNTCASRTIQARRVTPNVVLIVDQSGSMTADFQGAGSRWNVLRDSLLQQPDGLIASLQGQIRFGLAMYSGLSDDPQAQCPMMTHVAPMLDNLANIEASYRGAEPLDDTPTGDAIDAVIEQLGLASTLDDDGDPTVFILATDGEPDRCEQLDPQQGHDEAIEAVQRARRLGVSTYVISVGNDVSEQHHRNMANAGLGMHLEDGQAPFWVAGDDASLQRALAEIIGGQVSCDVALKGRVVDGDACTGTVLLSGRRLQCNDPDGWSLIDGKHIRIHGASCAELTSDTGATLSVSFPCQITLLE